MPIDYCDVIGGRGSPDLLWLLYTTGTLALLRAIDGHADDSTENRGLLNAASMQALHYSSTSLLTFCTRFLSLHSGANAVQSKSLFHNSAHQGGDCAMTCNILAISECSESCRCEADLRSFTATALKSLQYSCRRSAVDSHQRSQRRTSMPNSVEVNSETIHVHSQKGQDFESRVRW